jgi:citrate lyase subunit beta/citryl-CoA lyase
MRKLRRTMLFCPASNPKLLFTAHVYKPDCIIFDLEDAVKYDEKDSARDLLAEALKTIDYEDCEVFARINPLYTEFGETDVRELVKAGLKRVRLPMCEKKEDIIELDKLLTDVEKKNNIEEGSVKIQCAIETPKGVYNSLEIAQGSSRVISISFGAEDYTRTLGVDRTASGEEIFLARSQVALSASIAGVDAIDTVWSNLSDEDGFKREIKNAISLGFSGKSCIHPSQIDIVHEMFKPDAKEIEKSMKIISAAKESNIEKGGVITVDGKMVDIPVIAKAERVVNLAIGSGLIKEVQYDYK